MRTGGDWFRAGPHEEFTNGQRVDVAEASLIEISRTRMMERMVVPPVTVRGQRHDADDPADPIVGKTVAEKRAMAGKDLIVHMNKSGYVFVLNKKDGSIDNIWPISDVKNFVK